MTTWEKVMWRWQGAIGWVRGGATVLWLVLLGMELTSEELDADQFLRLLLLGGGGIFLLRHCVRATIKVMPRLGRKVALRALAQDPVLASKRSRKDVIPFLLGRDSKRVGLSPWRGRFESLMGALIHRTLSSPDPRLSLEEVMTRCLTLLRLGRRHWRMGRGRVRETNDHTGRFHGLDDEELLHFFFLVLTLLSALFRLHLLLWGMPRAPLDRENLSRLRGRWIRFCTLEPTTRGFPPPVPKEMAYGGGGQDMEIAARLIDWIFRGEQGALACALEGICGSQETARVPTSPGK